MNNQRRRRIESVIETIMTLLTMAVILVALCLAGYTIGTLI